MTPPYKYPLPPSTLTQMDSLPSEVVVQILSYLPGEDVPLFKRLSSHFKDLIARFESYWKPPVMTVTISNESGCLSESYLSHPLCISALTEAVKNTPCRIQSVRVPAESEFCELLDEISNSTKRTTDYPLLSVNGDVGTGVFMYSIEPMWNIFPKFARTTLEYDSENTYDLILDMVTGWQEASYPKVNFLLSSQEGQHSLENNGFNSDDEFDITSDPKGIAWIRFFHIETENSIQFDFAQENM